MGNDKRTRMSARGRHSGQIGPSPEVDKPDDEASKPESWSMLACMMSGNADEAAREAEIARQVDARSSGVTANDSSDGSSSSRRFRILEWRWFAGGASLLVGGLIVWILVERVQFWIVGAGVLAGLLLLVGASPLMEAGLQSGRVEGTASKASKAHRRARDVSERRGATAPR